MGLVTYHSLEEAVQASFGESVHIDKSSQLVMSDINLAKTLYLTNGDTVFLKLNTPENAGFFDAEEQGLWAIAQTNTIRTPKLFCKGIDTQKSLSFLMMEKIDSGQLKEDTWKVMGREFAAMHLADTTAFSCGKAYGFLQDNYIGATRQINTPNDSWVEFFRTCRLEPQFKMAEGTLGSDGIRLSLKLLDRLDTWLTEPSKPSLLHGDMWGGNHLVDQDGKVVLIDPAVYVGHAEADIAMTQMFSLMPRDFYQGYYEVLPKQEGYEDRRDLYNLYHYLNHFNLFGGHYLVSAMRIVMHFAG